MNVVRERSVCLYNMHSWTNWKLKENPSNGFDECTIHLALHAHSTHTSYSMGPRVHACTRKSYTRARDFARQKIRNGKNLGGKCMIIYDFVSVLSFVVRFFFRSTLSADVERIGQLSLNNPKHKSECCIRSRVCWCPNSVKIFGFVSNSFYFTLVVRHAHILCCRINYCCVDIIDKW